MNVYFELDDLHVGDEGKYFAAYNIQQNAIFEKDHQVLMWKSKRVWVETASGVRLVKEPNKQNPFGNNADIKEFLWIKLKCQSV